MIGGHWGMSDKWKALSIKKIAHRDMYLLLSKWLWRQGYIRLPSACSADTPHDECMPSCPSAILEVRSGAAKEEGAVNATKILTDAGVWGLSPFDDSYRAILHDAGLTDADLLDELCHVGSAGEMFTSAAPQDP